MLGIDLAKFPAVAGWMKRIAARPAWQKVQQ
jgi:glutathione S-transferase